MGIALAALALAGCASAPVVVSEPLTRERDRADITPISFAVVGDSITAWTSMEPGESSWVGSAAAARVTLAGGWAVSGATTSDMLGAIEAVPDADVLVIMAGTNDFLPEFPDWTLDASLHRITAIAAETAIDRVVLSAIAPNDHRTERTTEFNTALAELAARHHWTWVDPWSFVRNGSGGFVPGVSADGIHPSTQVEMQVGTLLRAAIVTASRSEP